MNVQFDPAQQIELIKEVVEKFHARSADVPAAAFARIALNRIQNILMGQGCTAEEPDAKAVRKGLDELRAMSGLDELAALSIPRTIPLEDLKDAAHGAPMPRRGILR